ncbi:hypothetical protein CRG98_004218 [Punica granatum]|uniref:Uncharacterized protein n=1 Tax=Punica granatum TaxID=22663 RepID=A0A2I0L3U9_PUNGR|nr:hypothetical protein CRG98_004218 [Punica granatum]
METSGGADRTCSEDRKVAGGRGMAVGADGGGNWPVKGWTVDACSVGSAGASMFSGAWVGGAHGVGSAVGSGPEGVCEVCAWSALEDVKGGRYAGGAPEYAGSMPAGVRGGGACVRGG